MHGCKLSHEEYAKLLNKVGNSYMPVEEKKKKKMTLRQIFFMKKKFKK